MKILITGSTGLLGQALITHLAPTERVVGVSRHAPSTALAGEHVRCDVSDEAQVARVIEASTPEVVIHTQALSDVDRCEREPQLAYAMNVQTTANLVRVLHGTSTRFVYVSTDYVFDGRKGSAYTEADQPHPLSVYAKSKVEGEHVALRLSRAVVARPSTLFGPARMNFCDHLVSRLKSGQPVEAFIDQVTSPTYTEDLAAALGQLSAMLCSHEEVSPRVYHMANAGSCSRVAFAQRVADLIGCSRTLIQAIPMAQQQRPAPRPACSALTTTQVPLPIRRILRPWDDALRAYLRQRHWLN